MYYVTRRTIVTNYRKVGKISMTTSSLHDKELLFVYLKLKKKQLIHDQMGGNKKS